MTMMKAMRWRQWLDYPSGVGLGVVNRLNPLHYCNLTSFSFSGGFCSSFSVWSATADPQIPSLPDWLDARPKWAKNRAFLAFSGTFGRICDERLRNYSTTTDLTHYSIRIGKSFFEKLTLVVFYNNMGLSFSR